MEINLSKEMVSVVAQALREYSQLGSHISSGGEDYQVSLDDASDLFNELEQQV